MEDSKMLMVRPSNGTPPPRRTLTTAISSRKCSPSSPSSWKRECKPPLILSSSTYQFLEEKIKSTNFKFRSGALELIVQSQAQNVPFVIVSCGITFFIEQQLKLIIQEYFTDPNHIADLWNNIRIYANDFIFDKDNLLIGQNNHLVGINLKKNFVSRYHDRSWRKNAIILGNTFEDGMLRVDTHDRQSIRCALNNDMHLENWRFMTKEGGDFDVVIKLDGNLFFPLWIMKTVAGEGNCLIKALEDDNFDDQYELFIKKNMDYKTEPSEKVVKWYIK